VYPSRGMHQFGLTVPLFTIVPFALMLLAIAMLPLFAEHFWEKNRNKAIIAGLLGLPISIYLLGAFPEGLAHSALEYASFIALLGSLYVIAGGIHISGDLRATPRNNALLLASGCVLANLAGTTGASMLLIRVFLRTNSERKHVAHLPLFFILLVSNCAGLLTPLGDPPLFLGYLRGVPFTWTLSLFPYWLLAVGYLLLLFYWIDVRAYARETLRDLALDDRQVEPVRISGGANIGLLLLVVAAIFLPTPLRELAMLACALVSLLALPKEPRQKNEFSYGPIVEVAVLFAGIFVTMVPALALLEARGSELGLNAPWHFFLITGALSSVLDNAPTYLTFLAAAQGLGGDLATGGPTVVGVPEPFLSAISLGAVFMGANTYIGNGPNFMVKAIAEHAGYATPSFFGYAGRALLVLTPLYLAIMFLLPHLG
jgi:Na+/H+ antiporter NhaD/arsenite permease-like protein